MFDVAVGVVVVVGNERGTPIGCRAGQRWRACFSLASALMAERAEGCRRSYGVADLRKRLMDKFNSYKTTYT